MAPFVTFVAIALIAAGLWGSAMSLRRDSRF
jgi:hypothetical protein